jgi:hypothetical protein
VAAVAQVLTHVGLLKAIQEHVRFARARFGIYDTIDFVVVLLGYALSGERSLTAYYARLSPFTDDLLASPSRFIDISLFNPFSLLHQRRR